MASSAYESWWKQFAATGNIVPVSLGMSRGQLQKLFGPPDDLMDGYPVERSPVLKYGELEFHFGDPSSEMLTLIYADTDEIVKVCIQRLS